MHTALRLVKLAVSKFVSLFFRAAVIFSCSLVKLIVSFCAKNNRSRRFIFCETGLKSQQHACTTYAYFSNHTKSNGSGIIYPPTPPPSSSVLQYKNTLPLPKPAPYHSPDSHRSSLTDRLTCRLLCFTYCHRAWVMTGRDWV